jgi:hypothetical protein
MTNLFRRNKKETVKDMTVKITWADNTTEIITATGAGMASVIADPCIIDWEIVK